MSSPDQEITLDATLAQGADLISVAREMSTGASPAPSLPGYSLQARLGAGTFGEAWSGTQLSTGQKVAVKVFSRHQSMDWSLFRAEVHRLMEVAEHPNVVTLLDANLENTPPFFVMPLMASSLADQAQVKAAQMASWLEEVCQGLSYIHQKGILHGDLKPANLLLDHEGRVRLADFGQSFATEAGGYNLGTLGYMPPEQVARALEHGQAAPCPSWDVYAMGATAYRLLTGQVPRLGMHTRSGLSTSTLQERLQLALEVSQAPLVPLRVLNPEVDSELAAIIEGCLEPLVDFRYPNTQAVLEELRRRREHMPLRVKLPWGAGYQLRLLLQRNPGAVAVGSVLMLVVLASVALGWREVQLERAKIGERQQALERATRDLDSKAEELLREQRGFHKIERSLGYQAQVQGDLGQAVLWWAQALRHDSQSDTLRYLIGSYSYPLQLYFRPFGPCQALALSPDGRRLACAMPGGRVEVFGGDGSSQVVQHPPEVSSLALNHDGQQLLTSGSSGQVLGWGLADGVEARFQDWLVNPTELSSLGLEPAHRRCALVAFLPGSNQRWMASADGWCQFMQQKAGWRVEGAPVRVSFSRSGQRLAIQTRRQILTVWSNQGELLRTVTASDGCLDESGQRLAWVDPAGQVWQQELAGGATLRVGTGRQVAFVAGQAVSDGWIPAPGSLHRFSGDGRRLAVVRGSRLQIYDSLRRIPASGEILHRRPIRQLTLSYDGQQVATDDGDLRWFDAHLGGGWKWQGTFAGQRLLLGLGRVAVQEGLEVVLRERESGREIRRQRIEPGYGWTFQGPELVIHPRGPVAWLSEINQGVFADGRKVRLEAKGKTLREVVARSQVLALYRLGGSLAGAVAFRTGQGVQLDELAWDGPIDQCQPLGEGLLVSHGTSLRLLGVFSEKNFDDTPPVRRLEQQGQWKFPSRIRELRVGGSVVSLLLQDGRCHLLQAVTEGAKTRLAPLGEIGPGIEQTVLSPEGHLLACLKKGNALQLLDVHNLQDRIVLPPELSLPDTTVQSLHLESSDFWLGTSRGFQHWKFGLPAGADLLTQVERWSGLRLGPTGQPLRLSPEEWKTR